MVAKSHLYSLQLIYRRPGSSTAHDVLQSSVLFATAWCPSSPPHHSLHDKPFLSDSMLYPESSKPSTVTCIDYRKETYGKPRTPMLVESNHTLAGNSSYTCRFRKVSASFVVGLLVKHSVNDAHSFAFDGISPGSQQCKARIQPHKSFITIFLSFPASRSSSVEAACARIKSHSGLPGTRFDECVQEQSRPRRWHVIHRLVWPFLVH